ncbi:MAG TPA: hypothetical protein VJ508_02685, partial [Saprospiraceae bacterium]|nr:hypothetical protein [Saprospiraceae bacterium]
TDRNWENDRISQRSNTGIHKDDFSFRIKSMPAKEFGSQGQIKSLIFSMHLAKYSLLRDHQGFTPLLVLDDIFDKLDEFRLSRLIDILSSPGFGQIFISDTSQERLLTHMKMTDYKALELT